METVKIGTVVYSFDSTNGATAKTNGANDGAYLPGAVKAEMLAVGANPDGVHIFYVGNKDAVLYSLSKPDQSQSMVFLYMRKTKTWAAPITVVGRVMGVDAGATGDARLDIQAKHNPGKVTITFPPAETMPAHA
jgi:hypothetical protein